MNVQCSPALPCEFPDDAWTLPFVNLDLQPANQLPEDWRSKLQLASPLEVEPAECETLLRYSTPDVRTPARIAEIFWQAGGGSSDLDSFWSVEVIACDPDMPVKPNTKRLVRVLLDNSIAPIFHFKKLFKRGRPFMCCTQSLNPLFKPGDALYPGHPSYPSGHATQAYAMAHLFTNLCPHLETRLMAAAANIALNREIAGVHYPSDSEAGRQLAKAYFDLFIQDDFVAGLLEDARKEMI